MQPSQLSERIRRNLDRMSDGARRVAEFVLERPEDVAMLPAARVAERLGISESTVTRFAVLLGYKGYPAFRRELQSDVRRSLMPLQRLALPHESELAKRKTVSAVVRQDIENILRTEQNILEADLRRAVALISDARTIYVMGLRASFGLAHGLYFQLQQMLGNVVLCDTGRGEGLDALVGIGVQDVLICVSFPRHAVLTVAATQFAHERHARIIAITDGPLSPVAGRADVMFSISTSILNVTTSLAGGLSLANVLCAEVLLTNRERAARNLQNVEEALQAARLHHTS